MATEKNQTVVIVKKDVWSPLEIGYLLPVSAVLHQSLLEYDWADISRRLTMFVLRRLGQRGNLHDAEEISQEAVRRLLDPRYADWDRSVEPSLLRHLGSIANGIISDRRQRKATTAEEFRETLETPDTGSTRDLETRVATGEMATQALAMIRERLSGDPTGTKVFELIMLDIDEPRDQAQRLQLSIRDVYNARRRIALHREAVRNLMSSRS